MTEKEKMEFWKNICNEFAESGLGKTEFSDQHKISPNQLYYYLYKFRPDAIKSTPKKHKILTTTKKITSFLPVKYKPEALKQKLNITLKTGHTISFDLPTDQIPMFIQQMESNYESTL